jgi:hypothetical protein
MHPLHDNMSIQREQIMGRLLYSESKDNAREYATLWLTLDDLVERLKIEQNLQIKGL